MCEIDVHKVPNNFSLPLSPVETRNNLQIQNLFEFNAGKAAFQCSGCIISRSEFIINVKSTLKARNKAAVVFCCCFVIFVLKEETKPIVENVGRVFFFFFFRIFLFLALNEARKELFNFSIELDARHGQTFYAEASDLEEFSCRWRLL